MAMPGRFRRVGISPPGNNFPVPRVYLSASAVIDSGCLQHKIMVAPVTVVMVLYVITRRNSAETMSCSWGENMRFRFALLAAVLVACGGNAGAGDAVNRIGITVGGIQLFGLHFERVYEDYAVRAEIGWLRSALAFSVSGVRYLDDQRHRPYIGIGYLRYLDVGGIQNEDIFCLPAGVDFHLDNNNFMHAEFTSCLSLQTILGNPPDEETFYYRLMPKPSMTTKRDLD